MTRSVLIPSAEHPIRTESTAARVVVRVGDHVVADSRGALTLREADYPPVQYIPLADVDQTLLAPTDTTSYCPYKGDCSYFSVQTADGETVEDVVWTYENPFPAVQAIAGHVAFYPDRAAIEVDAPQA
jgi:uncharacterized protein (DUF427 family)